MEVNLGNGREVSLLRLTMPIPVQMVSSGITSITRRANRHLKRE